MQTERRAHEAETDTTVSVCGCILCPMRSSKVIWLVHGVYSYHRKDFTAIIQEHMVSKEISR